MSVILSVSAVMSKRQFPLTFTVGFPHPVGAVGARNTHQLTSHQSVFGWALQGNDCAHGGAIALDDPLGAQGWQGHGSALSLT